MKKLLAIVQDPDNSKDFIKYLIHMAGGLDMKLHLLNIQSPMNYPLGVPSFTGQASAHLELSLKKRTEEAQQILDKLARDISSGSSPKVSIEASSETGPTLSVIDQYVSEKEISLIIFKSDENGRLFSQDLSNMEIIRNSNCPVWIIPRNTEFQPFDEIVYATDYNEADVPTLKKLVGLLSPFSPNITALHILDDKDFETKIKQSGFQEMLRNQIAYEKITVKSLDAKEDSDLGLLVNDFASLVSAKLIVVLKENKQFLERIFNPDKTKKIIREANIPVLIYHEN